MNRRYILIILLLFIRCTGLPEPVGHGDYYVTNNTSQLLLISALESWTDNEVELITNQIETGEKMHVYTFTEGSGGHVMPSNAFSEFTIYTDDKTVQNIIYSRVVNKDWIFEGTTQEGHLIYNLTIE